jgi:hypothetical protein
MKQLLLSTLLILLASGGLRAEDTPEEALSTLPTEADSSETINTETGNSEALSSETLDIEADIDETTANLALPLNEDTLDSEIDSNLEEVDEFDMNDLSADINDEALMLLPPRRGGGNPGGGHRGGGNRGGGMHRGGGNPGGGHPGGGFRRGGGNPGGGMHRGGGNPGRGGTVRGGHDRGGRGYQPGRRSYRYGGHRDRPGWNRGWRWNRTWRPGWWYRGIIFPRYNRDYNTPYNYYQCTAFDEYMNAYSAAGPTEDQAAYNALYTCGGSSFEYSGCYIPEGYCSRY